MEVGAVKQAFNNEVILLKKTLNQARIQIIHKLTRKAKTLAEKKATDKLKEKLNRKAALAVNEVLMIKKIKPKDLAKFIVTHKDDLNKYLNKPTVDADKACARLLLHKLLQEKYKLIRSTYSNIAIDDLFMSRLERQKLKKEKKELLAKKRDKKKGKQNQSISSEGDWNVEEIDSKGNNHVRKNVSLSNVDESMRDDDDEMSTDDEAMSSVNDSVTNYDNDEDEDMDHNSDVDSDNDDNKVINNSENNLVDDQKGGEDINDSEESDSGNAEKEVIIEPKLNSTKQNAKLGTKEIKNKTINQKEDKRSKLPKINKHKNKNIGEKIHIKKSRKETETYAVESNKILDPFFKTVTGDNYMTLAEPRAPDEVKDEHRHGNRQMRRAVKFGHAKPRPRQNYKSNPEDKYYNKYNKINEYAGNNDSYNKNNTQEFGANNNKYKKNNTNERHNDKYNKFHDGKFSKNLDGKQSVDSFKNKVDSKVNATKPDVPEKLHPSWEAKKKISSILPFQGKKTVFNE